jgi:hypothetical protein
MPYIKNEERPLIKETIDTLKNNVEGVGQLNYAISLLCHKYIEKEGIKYKAINDVIGVLECAKLELYRTIAGSYEDTKAKENGFVSNLDSMRHVLKG